MSIARVAEQGGETERERERERERWGVGYIKTERQEKGRFWNRNGEPGRRKKKEEGKKKEEEEEEEGKKKEGRRKLLKMEVFCGCDG